MRLVMEKADRSAAAPFVLLDSLPSDCKIMRLDGCFGQRLGAWCALMLESVNRGDAMGNIILEPRVLGLVTLAIALGGVSAARAQDAVFRTACAR